MNYEETDPHYNGGVDWELLAMGTYRRLWAAVHGYEPDEGTEFQPEAILSYVEEQLWRLRELEN